MDRTVYEVAPASSESQWTLQLRGGAKKEIFDTRAEAVARGRALCRKNRPSRLRIRRTDGDSQR